MAPYVPPTAPHVTEIFVPDMAPPKTFYQARGFTLTADRGDFVVFTWEGHELYLDQRPNLPPIPTHPQANLRVMVPNVDHYWTRAQTLNAPILAPLADRNYGLRDFTILDPDGYGLRFGTRLPTPHP